MELAYGKAEEICSIRSLLSLLILGRISRSQEDVCWRCPASVGGKHHSEPEMTQRQKKGAHREKSKKKEKHGSVTTNCPSNLAWCCYDVWRNRVHRAGSLASFAP
jgi:hypothetical protein